MCYRSGKNIFPIPKQEQYDLSRNILDILNTENNDTKNLKSFYSYIESDETGTARLNVDGTKSFLKCNVHKGYRLENASHYSRVCFN